MAAFGVITLILTCFVLVFYGYMAQHTDNDVSFFLSAELIMLVMNLCTNSGGFFGLCYLYLIVALAFAGLGFAVNTQGAISFYTSIGPWFKNTFTAKDKIGWQLLSFIIAPAGIVLYFVWYKTKREMAEMCGKAGLWGLLVWILLIWMILGLAL